MLGLLQSYRRGKVDRDTCAVASSRIVDLAPVDEDELYVMLVYRVAFISDLISHHVARGRINLRKLTDRNGQGDLQLLASALYQLNI